MPQTIFNIFLIIAFIYGFLWVNKEIKLINRRKDYVLRHLDNMTFEKMDKVYDGEYDLYLDD